MNDSAFSVARRLCGVAAGIHPPWPWAVEKWALRMNFVVNDLAFFVVRRLRYGGHRDAPPLAPPSKGGEALRNTRGGKSSFVRSQVFNRPP